MPASASWLASLGWVCHMTGVSFHSLRRAILGSCLALALVPWMEPRAETGAPTFAEWRTACERLPSNRSLGSRQPPRDGLPLPTFAPVDSALLDFFALSTNGPMSQPAAWVGTAPDPKEFFDCGRGWFAPPGIPFEPFAEKLVLPPGHRVLLMGDLHGDIRSLMAVLNTWTERKWLEGFTLREPGLHLVFLGDYTDRGHYGVEVLYTLLRLRKANPDRVHLVRGNHEDLNLVSRYGFLAEGEAKYGTSFNAMRILRAYDFLPVVLYLGTGGDFVQTCHGGMEPGFDPAALLSAPGTNRFQRIGSLEQKSFLRSYPEWLAGDASSVAAAARQFQDFSPSAPTSPSVLGFMWNDFTVFSDDPAFSHNPDRAYVYGRSAVEGLLRAASRGGPSVHGVIRAHQHSPVLNPLMRRLIASRGVFRHWQEAQSGAALAASPATLAGTLERETTRSMPENGVWTLNVTPDSVYGAGCGFGFATFAVLQLGARYADWRLTVETVEVPGL